MPWPVAMTRHSTGSDASSSARRPANWTTPNRKRTSWWPATSMATARRTSRFSSPRSRSSAREIFSFSTRWRQFAFSEPGAEGWTFAHLPLFSPPLSDGEQARMYRKYALITGFSVGLGFGGSAIADDVADQVKAIPGGVEDVSIGGTWQDGDRS